MCAESRQLRLGRFRIIRGNGKNELRVANIESVKKRLAMEERRIINIERDLADDGDGVFAVLVIKNAHVARDQTAKRIEREPPDRCFDAAFAQFFNDSVTPMPPKTFSREIPAAQRRDRDNRQDEKPQWLTP